MYGGVKRWLSLTYEKSEIVERHRSVGFLVGICFIVNAITGSGIPFISNVFQRTGIITVGALFAIYSYIAVQSSLFIVSSMRAVPGNEEFRAAIEFTTLVDFFFGRRAYLLSLVFFVMSLMSNTIESVVITSQTIDSLYVNLFGSTCALGLSPFEFFCTSDIDGQPSPFGDRYVLLTLGFLTVIALVIPFGLYSLEENMTAQIIFFVAALAIVLTWFGLSIREGPDFSKVPNLGDTLLYAPGTVMLNLAMASIIPSWVNLKKPSVDIKMSLVVSILVSVLLYTLGGYFPATILDIGDSGNLGPAMMKVSLLGKISMFLFPMATLVPSIPINMIVTASNLKRDGTQYKAIVIFFSFILPWILSIPLQTGTMMIVFISWTSLIFFSAVNFMIGPILYLKARSFARQFAKSRVLSHNQKSILLLCSDRLPPSIRGLTLDNAPDSQLHPGASNSADGTPSSTCAGEDIIPLQNARNDSLYREHLELTPKPISSSSTHFSARDTLNNTPFPDKCDHALAEYPGPGNGVFSEKPQSPLYSLERIGRSLIGRVSSGTCIAYTNITIVSLTVLTSLVVEVNQLLRRYG